MNSPPRAPRRPLRVEDFAVHRRNNTRRAINVNHINDVLVQSFMELNQAGMPAPPVQLPAWYLAKVNQGVVQIPADKRQNVIELEDIENGDMIVRIHQLGNDFFYLKKNWEQWMRTKLDQFPNRQVENPINRVPVTADQIDIFTAQVVAGGRRSRRATRRQAKRVRR
jgi:hypothetical protein